MNNADCRPARSAILGLPLRIENRELIGAWAIGV
jgi:hypothetical protein